MKVYRVKGKSKGKRYFRRGGSQRYVTHFTRTYSLPIDQHTLTTTHTKLPQLFLFFLFFIFSVFSLHYAATVITPTAVQSTLKNASATLSEIGKKTTITITLPDIPKINEIKLPPFTLPKVQLPHLPPLPHLSIPHISLQPITDALVKAVSFLRSVLNPTPFLQAISHISPRILSTASSGMTTIIYAINPISFFGTVWDSSWMLSEQMFQGILFTTHILALTLERVIPLLNPMPFFHVTGQIISGSGNALFHVLTTTIQGILFIGTRVVVASFTGITSFGKLIYTLGNVAFAATLQFSSLSFRLALQGITLSSHFLQLTHAVQGFISISMRTIRLFSFLIITTGETLFNTGSFLITTSIHAITVSVLFVSETTVAASRLVFQLVVAVLHMLDPRPFLFRVGAVIHYRVYSTERTIVRYTTAIWDIASPPFIFIWNILTWAVQKNINDLKGPSNVEQVQTLQAYPTPVVTQYTYTTQ